MLRRTYPAKLARIRGFRENLENERINTEQKSMEESLEKQGKREAYGREGGTYLREDQQRRPLGLWEGSGGTH